MMKKMLILTYLITIFILFVSLTVILYFFGNALPKSTVDIIVSFMIFIILTLLLFLSWLFLRSNFPFSKYQKQQNSKLEQFINELQFKNDLEVLELIKNEKQLGFTMYNLKRDKRLISELIAYKHINTLKYLIKNGINISGYREDIEVLLGKTYVTKIREKADFSDFFADRIN